MIEEFRSSRGRLGGPFEGATMLLLHTKGAKTGQARVNPLAYRPLGDNFAVFGSKAGAPTNPDWYHNLVANPRTQVEVAGPAGTDGVETVDVVARVAEGPERDRIWEDQKAASPAFADYEKKTSRTIPVIILERA
jgi:deazaflavin-dependent oxidoreductase (nitroreductase family)